MRSPFSLPNLFIAVVLMIAIGFIVRINGVREQHLTRLTSLAQATPPTEDPASPTGYAGGIRSLIVPEHNNDSYQWIAQTQLMLHQHEWRLRRVNYDNAPDGRAVRSTSPYRWWLALTSLGESKSVDGPPLAAVEKAALHADPRLQILALIFTTLFVAWRFGPFSAVLVCIGFATLFPFASAFLPGQATDYGLSLIAAIWSILPLLTGLQHASPDGEKSAATNARRWFFLAGVVGGLGLWVSVVRELPIILGIGAGAVLASFLSRHGSAEKNSPWRAWGLGGAVASLVAFLIEYFPSQMALTEWRPETIHPLYAVACLGLGELLARIDDGLHRGKAAWNQSAIIVTVGAVVVLTAIPAVLLRRENVAWFSADALATRLTNVPGGPTAAHLFAWLAHDHFNSMVFASIVPLLFFTGAAVWQLRRSSTTVSQRIMLSVAIGPVVLVLALACFQIRWWHFVDAAVLGIIVALGSVWGQSRARWLWSGLSLVTFAFGLAQILPPPGLASVDTVTETEVVSLVERDLAHWLANRAGPEGAIVLAPPSLTTSLYFHGGLRGLGTPYADNREGFGAALRLASSSSADEAQALVRKRGVNYIVMPSWDTYLDDYARLGSNQPEHTLVGLLHQWLPPRWLRAVPYRLPQIAGFENQSVAIFEVTDLQDNVTALSGLAEYFSEMEMLDQAAAVRHALEQSFPNEISSLVAQAQVSVALRDGATFTKIIGTLVPRLGEDEVQGLAWDRRVSLAIVLADGKRKDVAREQVERCLAELDEPLMRALSPVALYRLQVLAREFGLEIAEPSLRTLAPKLLPPEMRNAL